MANAAVQGIHRGPEPEVLVSLGGLCNAGERAKEVRATRPNLPIWLGGTGKEQARFQEAYNPDDLIVLEPSISTLDEAQKFILKAAAEGITVIGVLDYEAHITRTIFTLVRQANKLGVKIRFVPFVYHDKSRMKMFWALRELGVMLEAWKLWWYQMAKDDVATLQEVIDYYSEEDET